MPAVKKEVTLPELMDVLAPSEHLDHVSFDPQKSDARLEVKQVEDDNGVRPQVRFMVGDEDRTLTREAFIHLGQLLKIPGDYVAKTPTKIMLPHMNYWLTNGSARSIGFVADGDTIKMFTKGQYPPVSNFTLIDVAKSAADEVFGTDELSVYHFSNTLVSTSFSLTTPTEHVVKGVGDVVRAGVTIENSYAESSPLTISAYIHTLRCTNGQISADNVMRLAARHGGSEDQEWLRESLVTAMSAASTSEIKRLEEARDFKVEGHLGDVLRSMFVEYQVPQRFRDQIHQLAEDRAVTNLYDLVDTVTEVASNSEDALDNPVMARRLMRVGSAVSSHPRLCNSCFRLLD